MLVAILATVWRVAFAQVEAEKDAAPTKREFGAAQVLTPAQERQVDAAVDRALAWIPFTQQADGSFQGPDGGQPGITALCLLAYLSRGHQPGKGVYGERLNRAVDFVLACQKPDGVLCKIAPAPVYQLYEPSHGAAYSHAIAGLALCELYGMADRGRNARIRSVVDKAVAFTLRRQKVPEKAEARDLGGWRYYGRFEGPMSDLSITSWQLMFLRAAKNAGFEVPSRVVNDAIDYVKRCYDPQAGTFVYNLSPEQHYTTKAMAGAGALSLSLAGIHDSPMARSAGDYILRQSWELYNNDGTAPYYDRYHYGMFYCCQAMFQLGGKYWQAFFPRASRTLVANQDGCGAWQPENGDNSFFGNVYTTSLAVLVLTTPDQLLPIFQR